MGLQNKRRKKMAGQLIQRAERKWLVRVFLGRDSQTGKRRYHNHTVRGTKKDAQKYLNGKLREIDLGTYIEASKVSLNEYLDQWLEAAAKPRVRERTYGWYKELLGWYVRPSLGDKGLADIRPLDLQSLYSSLQEKKLSAKTIRHVHTTICTALTQAVRWRLLMQNPASMVKPPRHERREMQALSPEEAAQFLTEAVNDEWSVLFALALTTGMRPEEYLGLQWKSLDLEKGTATVQRTLVWRRKGGGWYLSEPKTSRSRRTVPLPASVTSELIHHKRKQGEQRLKAGPTYQNKDFVFANADGGPLVPSNLISRHFKPILKRAGLSPSLRLYDLRHSCATLLLSVGENAKVVSERLGHAGIAMTLDVYSHVLPSMQQAAAEKLERLLYTKTGTPLAHKKDKDSRQAASN
jgi:integrase